MAVVPQVMGGAFASALIPTLLTYRRRRSGRFGPTPVGKPDLIAAAGMALVLAAGFSAVALTSIHVLLPILAGDDVGRSARIALDATEAVLAAALLTPLALTVLF